MVHLHMGSLHAFPSYTSYTLEDFIFSEQKFMIINEVQNLANALPLQICVSMCLLLFFFFLVAPCIWQKKETNFEKDPYKKTNTK